MRYRIRFNVHHQGSGLVWRIFDDATEHLASSFALNVPSWGEQREENDIRLGVVEMKWNVCCDGILTMSGTVATIDPC